MKKKVTILRGIPGSGKSTYAKKIMHGTYQSVRCSADKYFHLETGEYKFEADKLSEAHNYCLDQYLTRLVWPYLEHIVVDNTNIAQFEFAPYYRLAEVYKYDVEIVSISCNIELAISRQVHNVPREKIELMARLFDTCDVVPHWWKHTQLNAEDLLLTKENS